MMGQVVKTSFRGVSLEREKYDKTLSLNQFREKYENQRKI